MNLRKLLGIKSKEEKEEVKMKEILKDEQEIIGLKAKALAAFEEDVKNKKATAKRQFKKDFNVEPDEVSYLGDWYFLFKANGFYIKGFIEWFPSGYLYCRYYRLAVPCREPHCERLIVDEKSFYDLAGLGEAINEHRDGQACDDCARRWASD